ncbi:MAG: hypothetical protein WD356_10295 [Pseudomonadales bacterium]
MNENGAAEQLELIEHSLDEGSYRRGQWQRFLREAAMLDAAARRRLADDITRVSRKLHRRNGPVSIPFMAAFTLEVVIFMLAVMSIFQEHVLAKFLGIVLLALCLQPLIKIVTGMLLGVRYDYAYLWYIEPRFKMQFGTYFQLPPMSRVLVHLSGGIGTPLAMLTGYWVFLGEFTLVAYGWLLLFFGAAALQVGAFVAEWIGIHKVGPFRLSNLTSPATAAMELKAHLDRVER